MRVTGGCAKGIQLKTVHVDILRPATDYIREAVFSSLGSSVVDASCLDLFSGTGSYGIESISRGASNAVFVENNKKIAHTIQLNIQAVKYNIPDANTHIYIDDVFHWLKKYKNTSIHGACMQFELIFLDPPYALARERYTELINLTTEYMSPSGHLVFELPSDLSIQEVHHTLTCCKQIKKTGKNSPNVYIFKKQ